MEDVWGKRFLSFWERNTETERDMKKEKEKLLCPWWILFGLCCKDAAVAAEIFFPFLCHNKLYCMNRQVQKLFRITTLLFLHISGCQVFHENAA